MAKALRRVLQSTMKSGAGNTAFEMSFDTANPRAIAWAEAHAAELITSITEDVRAAIRLTVRQGIEGGLEPHTIARLVRSTVGLTPRDAQAVLTQHLKDLASGMNAARATSRATRYADKLLRSRALNIARTETMRASNQGQLELWKQAKDAGLLAGTEKKVWMTADACPRCRPLDGEQVGLDDQFSAGVDPPLHPRCRCTIGMVA